MLARGLPPLSMEARTAAFACITMLSGEKGDIGGSARTSYKQSYAITVAVSNVRLAVKWLDVHRGRWYGYIARMESKVERSNQAGNPTLGKLR